MWFRILLSYRRLGLLSVALIAAASPSFGQNNFVGAQFGVSTLSADGISIATGSELRTSLYKPEDSATVMLFGGRHLSDLFSIQGSYSWNRNDLALTSMIPVAGRQQFYEQSRQATMHSAIGELLLYFRGRKHWARPYLTVGGGAVQIRSDEGTLRAASDPPLAPPGPISSTDRALRVAVGIDLFTKGGWAFRYTFSETFQPNPISARLTPPAERHLKNFQNFFGFVKQF